MYCKQCGNQLNEGVAFCDQCGASVLVEGAENKTKKQTNILASVGMIVSLVSIFLNFWGIVGIAAIVLSFIGLNQISTTGEEGKGFAITGIVIGIISVIYAFIMIVMLF